MSLAPRPVLAAALLACLSLLGAAEPQVPAAAGALPVLHEGRIKPLAIAAEELVLVVAGKTPFGTVVDDPAGRRIAERAPATALVVGMMADPAQWRRRPLVQVPWLAQQREFAIPGQWAALAELEPALTRIASLYERRQRADQSGELQTRSRDDDALMELARRIDQGERLLAGRALALAPLAPDAADRAWVLGTLAPLLERGEHDRAWRGQVRAALRRAADERDDALARADAWLTVEDLCLRPDPVLAGLCATGQAPAGLVELMAASAGWWRAVQSGADYPAAHARLEAALRERAGRRETTLRAQGVSSEAVAPYPAAGLIALELAYHRAKPFTWGWIAFLAGAAALAWGLRPQGGRKARVAGALLVGAALAVCGAGLAARIAITGLGAVSNLYETLVYVAVISGALGLVLWRLSGRGGFAVAGALAAALCAMVGEAIPPEYGASIGQLQPVLRSRFWLWLHVKVVVAAYAPFVLAWVLGNAALWRAWRRGTAVGADEARALYRCLQVGTVLMAAGTLLGGVWADQAWGRFWGWDAKEVGALIVVLVYLVPLHLRHVGWVGSTGMAAWSVLGFLSVLWSWYGVNFIQAAGLHTYGFGSSTLLDKIVVGAAVLAQCLLTAWQLAALRARRDGSAG